MQRQAQQVFQMHSACLLTRLIPAYELASARSPRARPALFKIEILRAQKAQYNLDMTPTWCTKSSNETETGLASVQKSQLKPDEHRVWWKVEAYESSLGFLDERDPSTVLA
ncbi:hypothetical protein ONZ51_g10690 [Trametes cubensis]|uniref:Uncharacterized protein n=1 Tax=Trametes cubensis TaxID=1111947 RepID=A0AAD7X8L5_9APHY|nr:hypothetical protein ONZ51_g10690 [Trametes cubensis]